MHAPLLSRIRPRNIVVFRALQLGDMLCAIPSLRALRMRCPDAAITLVGLPWAAGLAARFPHYIDDFLPFPGFPGLPERAPDLSAIPAFVAEAQTRGFDLAIQMHGSGGLSNPVVALFGAARQAGFGLPDENGSCLPYPTRGSEVGRLLALMDHLGAPSSYRRLEFPLLPADHSELATSGIAFALGGRPYVCIHPGARDPRRRWPAERFAAVADAVHALTGWTVVLTGSGEERALTARVRQAMHAPAIDAASPISAGALAALIGGARLLVCNDTGVSHLAAALRTPSVVIFRCSELERWAPEDRMRHRCVMAPDEGTTTDQGQAEVMRQIRGLFDRGAPASTGRASA